MTETTNSQAGGAMQVDASLVRQLAELLDETNLTEIEVQDGERRIRVARTVTVAAQAAPVAAPAAAPPPPAAAAPAPAVEPANHPGTITSPIVGTAYLSASPGGKPFVAVGDSVAAGDTLLIVEAMKVMNPIVAARAGKVIAILVDSGQPVDFGHPLLVVE